MVPLADFLSGSLKSSRNGYRTSSTADVVSIQSAIHGRVSFGRWMVNRREEGFNPSGIAKLLKKKYELWVYPGDIFSWLDSLIHNLKAVQRIAAVAGETDLNVEIEEQIARIERPLLKKSSKKENS